MLPLLVAGILGIVSAGHLALKDWQFAKEPIIALGEAPIKDLPVASATGVPPIPVTSPWHYNFSSTTTVEEATDAESSMDPYFWLDSGARMQVLSGIGQTLRNKLPATDPWVVTYQNYNALDTDNGFRPQNIFRLLTRSHWKDFTQEVDFKIRKLNMTTTSARDGSNGLLLMNRYLDQDNLYYAGIRVDGTAVIKKKIDSNYFTMAQKPLYTHEVNYNVNTTPNFLPGEIWIGVRSTIKTNADGTVTIQLFVDKQNKGVWVLAASAVDDGVKYGGPVIDQAAMAGIRTDFMDVQFDNLRLTDL